jgi:hypothetical protein
MKHSDFTFIRQRNNGKIYMVYGEEENNFDDNGFDVVAFKDLPFDALLELAENIYEDKNLHTHIYKLGIMAHIIKKNVDEEAATKILRDFILEIEK